MDTNQDTKNSNDNHHQLYNENQRFNPFDQSSSQLTEGQDQQAYPLCLGQGKQSENGRNTPLSRLSETTYQSEIKLSIWSNKRDQAQVLSAKQCCDHHFHHASQNKNESLFELKSQIKQLTLSLSDLQCYSTVLQKRNQELAVCLQKQKLKNSHLEHAINLFRKDDQHLDKKLQEQCELYAQIKTELEQERDVNLMLTQKLQNSTAENNYFKQLILIANNNYQVLDRKYTSLVESNKKVEEVNLEKEKELTCNMNEMKLLLTNLINSPKGSASFNPNLSFGEQDENNCIKKMPLLTSNRNHASQQTSKKPAEEIYRKMFLKTLKTKK